MVAKLRAAGAILLGKTNMDEYAPAGIARSAFGGQTCNPYDTTRIPGGIERRLGRGGGGQSRHVRPGHGHIRARCAFRHRAAAWSAWSRPKGW